MAVIEYIGIFLAVAISVFAGLFGIFGLYGFIRIHQEDKKAWSEIWKKRVL